MLYFLSGLEDQLPGLNVFAIGSGTANNPRTKLPDDVDTETGASEFDDRIANADAGGTACAASAQQEPAEYGDILECPDGMAAMRATGARDGKVEALKLGFGIDRGGHAGSQLLLLGTVLTGCQLANEADTIGQPGTFLHHWPA